MQKFIVGLLAVFALSSFAAEVRTLLGGALLYLAQKEGLQLSLEGLQVSVLSQRVSFDSEQTLEAFISEKLPGYRLVREGEMARIMPEQAAKPKTSVSASPSPPPPTPKGKIELRYVLSGAEFEEVPFPEGLKVLGVIQERGKVEGNEISLTLSPLEMTCLERANDAVCLRPVVWQGEGELQVSLGGEVYKVKYRIGPSQLILRKVSLDGSYADVPVQAEPIIPLMPPTAKPAPAKVTQPLPSSPKPSTASSNPTPAKPSSTRLLEGYYVKDPTGPYVFGILRLSKASKISGSWLSLGTYCDSKNKVFSSLPKNHLLQANTSGCVRVLVANTKENLALARQYVKSPSVISIR